MSTNEQFISEIQEKKFVFTVENEKFLNNLEVLKRNSEQVYKLAFQMKSLFEEFEIVRADLRSLEKELNQTAIAFGLQPIPTKLGELRFQSPVLQEE